MIPISIKQKYMYEQAFKTIAFGTTTSLQKMSYPFKISERIPTYLSAVEYQPS